MSIYQDQLKKTLHRVERLKVLRDLALIDSDEELIYDRFTQLASKILGTPVSLVSMVAANYQFFKSQVGLPEPWKSKRSTPLSHSFCQHVVATNTPLIVSDARENPLVKTNLAIRDFNVIGYLGMPLTLNDGQPLGSFCVIHNEPHEWEQVEVDIMQELAELITAEFDMRAVVRAEREREIDLIELQNTLEKVIRDLQGITDKHEFLSSLRASREKYRV